MKNVRLVSITKVSIFISLQKFKQSVKRNIPLCFNLKKLTHWNIPIDEIGKKYVHRKLPIIRKINLSSYRKSHNVIFSIIAIIQENTYNLSKIIKNNQKLIKL